MSQKVKDQRIQNQKDPKAKIMNPLTAPPPYVIKASWSGWPMSRCQDLCPIMNAQTH